MYRVCIRVLYVFFELFLCLGEPRRLEIRRGSGNFFPPFPFNYYYCFYACGIIYLFWFIIYNSYILYSSIFYQY
jgi:hypothetical protein